MKISFGLVVRNEQEIIQRCFDSIRDISEDVVVVHDGNCEDRTLEIAARYTDKIYVRPKEDGSDPHRLFILRQAKNDWVFMIDADEFLSEELKNYLGKFCAKDWQNYGALAFKWPIWNGKKYVTYNNYRPCLFNKNQCWAIALHNFSIQTVGKIKKVDCILEHRPRENKARVSYFWGSKIKNRLDRDAKQFLVGWNKLDKYNDHLIPDSFKNWYFNYINHPLFYCFWNFVKYFLGSYKNLYTEGWRGLFLSFNLASYQSRLAFKIWRKK